MSTFDDTGLSVDRYDAVLLAVQTALKSAFGDNIKLTPDSVAGQLAQIFAYAIAEQNELIEAVKSAFDPQGATGSALSSLVLLNGISRNESRYSSVELSCTANAAGCTIPAGSLISDPVTQVQFATDIELEVGSGLTETVSATAVTEGAVEAVAESLTQIDTPIYGWSAVTNVLDAVVGASEETDAELRVRRQRVAERAGTCNVPAIYAAISELDGVESLAVYQNTADEYDDLDIPPHSIWAIVSGGNAGDIAEAIFEHVGAGIGMHGLTEVIHDPGFESGQTFEVHFTRPTVVPIYLDLEITTDDDFPVDGIAQILIALEEYFDGLGVGDAVIASRLYTPINTVPGVIITHLYIDREEDPSTSDPIVLEVDELATLDVGESGDVVITQDGSEVWGGEIG